MEKLSAPPAFGYDKIGSNLLKVVGYVPLVGSFAGIGRIVAIAFSPKYEVSCPKLYLAGRIGRGAIEILSLGIVFLPFDAGITIYRKYCKKVDVVEAPCRNVGIEVVGIEVNQCGKIVGYIPTGPKFLESLRNDIELYFPQFKGRRIITIMNGKEYLNNEGMILIKGETIQLDGKGRPLNNTKPFDVNLPIRVLFAFS